MVNAARSLGFPASVDLGCLLAKRRIASALSLVAAFPYETEIDIFWHARKERFRKREKRSDIYWVKRLTETIGLIGGRDAIICVCDESFVANENATNNSCVQ
jgi:hypothetical protein